MGGQQEPVRRGEVLNAVAFVGWSGAGKTTLIEKLLPLLARDGCTVGYLKSDAHSIRLDPAGKDTDRIRRSGACRVGIASAGEVMLRVPRESDDPEALLKEWYSGCDLVLAEGFKGSRLPKIEVVRGEPVLAGDDPTLLAVVSAGPDDRPVPRFAPADTAALADFVRRRVLG